MSLGRDVAVDRYRRKNSLYASAAIIGAVLVSSNEWTSKGVSGWLQPIGFGFLVGGVTRGWRLYKARYPGLTDRSTAAVASPPTPRKSRASR